jgi:hypothetical protein
LNRHLLLFVTFVVCSGTTTTTTTTGTTGDATQTAVTTVPAANPDQAVTPTQITPDEKVPAAVQAEQAAAQAAATSTVQSSVPADIVSVGFRALGKYCKPYFGFRLF